jgi:uncharacterized phage protein (TIGR01671 family)
MRELKFRAWDKNRKEMTHFGDLEVGVTEGDWHPSVIGQNMGHDTWEWVEGGDFVIMQFTGLKDKNRKEIYEEDILKITVYNIEQMYERGSVHQTIPGKIVYSEHFGTLGIETKDGTVGNRKIFTSFHPFTDFNIRSKEYEWEILGNGYEDPKLLEKYEKNNI